MFFLRRRGARAAGRRKDGAGARSFNEEPSAGGIEARRRSGKQPAGSPVEDAPSSPGAPPAMRPTALALALLLASAALAPGAPARADAPPEDAPAPSLETRTDTAARPWVAWATSVDAVGAVLGDYAVRLDVGLKRFTGVAVSPGWRRAEGRHGPLLKLRWALQPMGRGVDGLGVELLAEAAWMPSENGPDRVELGLGAELAYRWVWEGVLLGGALGARRRWRWEGERSAAWLPSVRVWLGFGWM